MKILFLLAAYLVGAISAGFIIFRLREKKDIRKYGSHNIGATNILRMSGWKTAIPVLLFDTAKGFFPVFLGARLFNDPLVPILAGAAAVLGHCFPLYLRFKGGKGIATTIGVYLALAWQPVLGIIGVFLMVVIFTRYISLGSVTAAFSYPFFVILFRKPTALIFFGIFIFLLVIYTHRENIKRLRDGTERKLGEKLK